MSWEYKSYNTRDEFGVGDIILVYVPPRGRTLARVTKIDGSLLIAESSDGQYEEHPSCINLVLEKPGVYELATRRHRLR